MFRQMAPAFGFPLRFLLGNLWLTKPLVMAAMPMVSPFGEALMATTCCFTMMKGSDAANVIPKEPYLIAPSCVAFAPPSIIAWASSYANLKSEYITVLPNH